MKDKTDDGLFISTEGIDAGEAASPVQQVPPFISYEEIPLDLLFPESAFQIMDAIADTRIPLLIVGEKGLGKHYLAQLFHEAGCSKGEPFRELYLRRDGKGDPFDALYEILKQSSPEIPFRGTLYISGLENASCILQKTLLHMLEKHSIGFPDGRHLLFEGRLAASVDTPLEILLSQETFLPGLYYRLQISPVMLKPLRERRDDIPPLADIFLRDCTNRLMVPPKNLSPDAVMCLKDYQWPGNLPEFESVLYRSVLFSANAVLKRGDIMFASDSKAIHQKKHSEKSTPRQYGIIKEKQPQAAEQAGSAPIELSIAHLVAELSHEIKNPLVAIKTFIQLLPGHINDPEFLSDFFGVAAQSIDRINYLTERMLEFAKFTTPVCAPIHLPSLVSEVLRTIDSYESGTNINWEKEFPDDNHDVSADRDQLCYALENILLHIAQQIQDGRRVRLSLKPASTGVLLKLSYSGVKNVQGIAFLNARGEGVSDLEGLDLFLAQQILQRNSIGFTKDDADDQTTIKLVFPLS